MEGSFLVSNLCRVFRNIISRRISYKLGKCQLFIFLNDKEFLKTLQVRDHLLFHSYFFCEHSWNARCLNAAVSCGRNLEV